MINESSRDDSLEGLLQELYDSIMRRCEVMLPCVVTAVSDDREKLTVRPLLKIVPKSGDAINRDVIEGVRVATLGAGDILMSFPIKVGDLGWIESSDRDLSIFLQSFEDAEPPTRRKHSFSDGRFIPDIMTNFTIAEEDADAVVIQNRDGSVKIALDGSQIRIVNGSTRIEINDGTVIGIAPNGFDLNGAKITPDGDVVTASGVSLDKHPHEQANDSGNNVEEPTEPPTATE